MLAKRENSVMRNENCTIHRFETLTTKGLLKKGSFLFLAEQKTLCTEQCVVDGAGEAQVKQKLINYEYRDIPHRC